jgi:hypothetical protein
MSSAWKTYFSITLVRKTAKIESYFRHVCLSVRLFMCLPVRMEQLGSHCTDIHKIWYWSIFRKSDEIFYFHQNMTERTDTLHEDVCTFAVKSHSFLKVRNILDEVLYKIKIHILCPVTFSPHKNHVVYELMWKKYNRTREIEERNITAGMCFLC